MLDPLGFQCIRPQSAFLVFLVILEVTFEPFHMRFAFKRQNMRAQAVQEKAPS